MANEINVDKIKKELSKGDANQQYDALQKIKEFVSKNMAEEQKKKEDEANELQSKIDRINNY